MNLAYLLTAKPIRRQIMKFFTKCALLLVSSTLLFHSAYALDDNDQQAINRVINRLAKSWNFHAGEGFGRSFTDDADFVSIFGRYISGKEAIEARYKKLLQGSLKDSKIQFNEITLREVQPGLVIALVKWQLSKNEVTASCICKNPKEGLFTQVLIKNGDCWRITASQNTRIKHWN
jgi:uncharacterized protein (TIGR02246 family)